LTTWRSSIKGRWRVMVEVGVLASRGNCASIGKGKTVLESIRETLLNILT
jgi:hypothetical protein